MTMTMASLFAGIGGWDLAAERVGIDVLWQSETDKYASAVLERHWPGKNRGDIHDIKSRGADELRPDIITAGFPCQSYSYAGRRGGLAADHGALWWEVVRLAKLYAPSHIIGENVPGLLSSGRGADFRTILDSLVDAGYGVSWRVLDSQWFGVAQRRRRLYIHAHRHPRREPRPEVLALGEGLSGHPQPSRQAGPPPGASTPVGVGGDHELAHSLTSSNGGLSAKQNQHTLVVESSSGKDITGTLTTAFSPKNATNIDEVVSGSLVVMGAVNQRGELREMEVPGALPASWTNSQAQFVVEPTRVRRLTETECERLQGFPVGHTEGHSMTQRYKMLGNAQTVPVAEWILRRIVALESQ